IIGFDKKCIKPFLQAVNNNTGFFGTCYNRHFNRICIIIPKHSRLSCCRTGTPTPRYFCSIFSRKEGCVLYLTDIDQSTRNDEILMATIYLFTRVKDRSKEKKQHYFV